MQFTIVQPHPCSVTDFFDLLEGETLESHIVASSSSSRTALGTHWDDSVFVRRTRIRPSRELPAVIARLLGPDGLSYVQTVWTDRSVSENRWDLTVERVGDRVQIGGVERVEAAGDHCRVSIETEIHIRVPVIGRKVEQAVKREIERVYGRRLGVITDLYSSL